MTKKAFVTYPTLEEALYLHDQLLKKFGGASGVRDLGLLESALARPRSGYYKTLFEQAAALMQSLALNHSFVDGNKRVAFALTAVFLNVNGYLLRCDADTGEEFLIGSVIKKKDPIEKMADWLKNHSTKK